MYLLLISTHDTALGEGKQQGTGHISKLRVWVCEWHLHCNSSTYRFSFWLWHLDGSFWSTVSAEAAALLAFFISPCVILHWTRSPRCTWAPTGIPAPCFAGLVSALWINTHLLENSYNLAKLTQRELTAYSSLRPAAWKLRLALIFLLSMKKKKKQPRVFLPSTKVR